MELDKDLLARQEARAMAKQAERAQCQLARMDQGQIDKILSGKPEERRELFDEAAGIVKFKRRKANAQKKLEEEK